MNQSAIDKLLQGGFGSEGWEGLNDNGASQAASYEQQLKQYQYAKDLVEGISPPALAILHDVTMIPPTWDVENNGLINAIGYGIFREGQKSIYQYIEQCRQIVENGPPEPPESMKQTGDNQQ